MKRKEPTKSFRMTMIMIVMIQIEKNLWSMLFTQMWLSAVMIKQGHFKEKLVFNVRNWLNILIKFVHMWVIFTHLKLWVAVARHNFRWVKI